MTYSRAPANKRRVNGVLSASGPLTIASIAVATSTTRGGYAANRRKHVFGFSRSDLIKRGPVMRGST